MEFQRIAVIGAGTMGNGIAQIAAMNGIEVGLRDVNDAAIQRGLDTIRTSLSRFIKAQKLSQAEADAAFARIHPTTDLAAAVRGAQVVIEAVPELLDLKREVFQQLDALAAPEVVLATNTSQLSITSIAAATKRPDKVIGMHFFNPPVIMRLVEIIRGLETSDATLEVIQQLSAKLGKETVVCKKDTVGFITSRAISALRMECIRIYEEGIASLEDIDKAMRLGFNHPMGPFELNDFNGLDTGYYAALSLRDAYGERFNPPQSLVQRVRAGHLGRKTGRGWYDYAGGEKA
jgi:3-hydroxybutyryl-CoA dehydrogenase